MWSLQLDPQLSSEALKCNVQGSGPSMRLVMLGYSMTVRSDLTSLGLSFLLSIYTTRLLKEE